MIPENQAREIVAALDIAVSDAVHFDARFSEKQRSAETQAQHLAERILSDNFCYNVIVRALLAEAAPRALRQISSVQRRDLLERLHVHPGASRGASAPPAPAPRGTTWTARRNQYTEKAEIHAFCSACSQSIIIPHFEEPLGEKPLTFSHCGKNESIPTEVVAQFYRLRSGPTDADRAFERKVFVDTNKEIVEKQAAKDRALTERLVGPNNIQVPPKPTKFLD